MRPDFLGQGAGKKKDEERKQVERSPSRGMACIRPTQMGVCRAAQGCLGQAGGGSGRQLELLEVRYIVKTAKACLSYSHCYCHCLCLFLSGARRSGSARGSACSSSSPHHRLERVHRPEWSQVLLQQGTPGLLPFPSLHGGVVWALFAARMSGLGALHLHDLWVTFPATRCPVLALSS